MLEYQKYPECLPNVDACDDTRFYNERLSERSNDLFTDPGDVSVDVEEFSTGDESEGDPSVLCRGSRLMNNRTHISNSHQK
jgi:hypothetical protein